MEITVSALAVLVASASCALSLAVALRVKKLLDPLIEEGALSSSRRPAAVATGTAVPEIGVVTDVHGEEVELPVADGAPWVLTFQAVGCSGCKEQLPAYKRFLKAQDIDPDRVFSIITGDVDGLDVYRDELDGLSRIVHADQELSRRLFDALGVEAWPTYLVVSETGKVGFSTRSSAALIGSGISLGAPAAV